MFAKALVVLAVAAQVFATPFITAPVAATTWSGGAQQTITWQESGQAPSLKDFGPSRISIYVGNAQQQTSLQVVAPSVDVSTTSSVQFTVDPAIGPNSDEYFIRIESLAFKDPGAPQFPALAFSAKFTLDKMTGTFTPAIESQIAGQATAPLASQSPARTTTTPAATATPARTTTTSTPAAPTNTADNSESDENAALSSRASYAAVVIGAVVAGAVLF